MTDPIASASIFIRPDTTGFRAQLEAQIRAATAKPITVPVVATPITGKAAASITQATGATTALATATTRQVKAAASEHRSHDRLRHAAMGQLQRGAASATLSDGRHPWRHAGCPPPASSPPPPPS